MQSFVSTNNLLLVRKQVRRSILPRWFVLPQVLIIGGPSWRVCSVMRCSRHLLLVLLLWLMKLWKEAIKYVLLFLLVVIVNAIDLILVHSAKFNDCIHLICGFLHLQHPTAAVESLVCIRCFIVFWHYWLWWDISLLNQVHLPFLLESRHLKSHSLISSLFLLVWIRHYSLWFMFLITPKQHGLCLLTSLIISNIAVALLWIWRLWSLLVNRFPLIIDSVWKHVAAIVCDNRLARFLCFIIFPIELCLSFKISLAIRAVVLILLAQ